MNGEIPTNRDSGFNSAPTSNIEHQGALERIVRVGSRVMRFAADTLVFPMGREPDLSRTNHFGDHTKRNDPSPRVSHYKT